MQRVYFLTLLATAWPCGPALAHPHAGGIVVRSDGAVIAGDILHPRLLVINPRGATQEVTGVGHVRDLELAPDGTIYGVSQGAGLWRLGLNDRVEPVRPQFHGLFTFAGDGSLVLAPADARDRRPRLEFESLEGRRTTLSFGQIESLTRSAGGVAVADGSAVREVSRNGAPKTWADDVGEGLHGLTATPEGLVVAVYSERQVVELTAGGVQRVLLTSEPPWAPTDVAFHDGALYVLEFAQHPCCWKGPRVRRVVEGEAPITLLTIDDGDHHHPFYESPWFLLGLCVTGGASLTVIATVWSPAPFGAAGEFVALRLRRRNRIVLTPQTIAFVLLHPAAMRIR
jgi:hypothetical protein